MHRSLRRLAVPALFTASVLALAGCASGDPAEEGGDAAAISIVASTNVYADIARAVAGEGVEVVSIIDDISQDPHEYEATGRDALALSEADVVILNGGGYDEFMETLLAAQDGDPVVLNAVELSGLAGDDDHGHEEGAEDEHADEEEHADEDEHAEEDGHEGHDHGEFNEHVWYHFPTMSELAHELAHELGELDPANAEAYEENAHVFMDGIGELEDRAAGIAAEHPGVSVAITEPVPLYLFEELGFANLTPGEFSEAVEEGRDAPVLVVQELLAIVAGQVAFLAYNEQTVGPQTEEVRAAAEAAGTPVVSFSELLPEGEDYLGWMAANLDAIEAALG